MDSKRHDARSGLLNNSVAMKSEKTFAEESRTIPDIIHSNVDRKPGEPAGHPERTTFEPFESFEDPLGSAPEAEVARTGIPSLRCLKFRPTKVLFLVVR
jgi:hypothetical protein